ncbi:MAG: penicillin acylase family protein [Candidatus Promineifilaceae bacterium]
MSRGLKFLFVAAGILVVLALVSMGVWRWFTHQAFPKTDGNLTVAGLNDTVAVVRDEYGVPHIYASNPDDLYFAEGYVHAQERFWQMEFQRRVGSGRLSEIFGEATLDTDIYLRHFGFYQLSTEIYEQANPETRQVLDAYTAGVNAYISDRKPAQLGLEFAFLGLQGVDVEVEPWTPQDSLVWGMMLVFDQSDQLSTELRDIDLLTRLGNDMYEDLRPPYRADRPTIIPDGELVDPSGEPIAAAPPTLDPQVLAYLQELNASLAGKETLPPLLADLGFQINAGSNSFVVSGDKTTTGMPILANDPHMSINMPNLWYEVGMHCVEKSADCLQNFRGFSLPGVPGILIGHNDRIAWGLTNASFDAEDVFIERINPENPNQYEVNGEWVDMELRQETIQVRGQDKPVVITVRKTRNGVVATDRMIDQHPFSATADGPELYALSYAWTALEPVFSVQAVMMVNVAQNWDDFNEALQYFDAGKQNWLYADMDGNIGYVMPGKVPIRAGGDGSLPVPGWNDDFIWTGFLPYDEAPRAFNPAQGFIATANNPQVRQEDYPYFLGVFHDRGQRAARITNLIQSDTDGISVEDMMAIQTDNYSISAEEVIPYLATLSFDDSATAEARDRLLDWEPKMLMDSSEAALFNLFFTHLVMDSVYDQLPQARYLRGESYTSDVIYDLLQDPESGWWDDIGTEAVETRDQILTKAFEEAYADGVDRLGDNIDDWQWGDLHTITFRNATLGESGIGFIENIFNRGPFPTNGSESVVQKTCWSTTGDNYEVACIPALRQVVDLSDLSNSRMVHSVGQSGHPMNEHYDDFIDLWRLLDYHPSNWLRTDAESGNSDTLILNPA